MRIWLCGVLVVAVGFVSPALAARCFEDDPAKVVAEDGNRKSPLHLALHGVSWGQYPAVLDFNISLEPPANRWFYVSERPWITKLTDTEGHPLYDPAPDDNYNRSFKEHADWLGPERGIFSRMTRRIKSDKIEILGIVEATAEITFADELEYIDLGELTNESRTIEFAPGARVVVKFDLKARSCTGSISILDERDDRSKRHFVGIETFDAMGQACTVLAAGMSMHHIYRSDERVPKTGRLAIANKLERVAVKLHAENVELDEVFDKKLLTMSPAALREAIATRNFSDEKLYELMRKAQFGRREDLAEILVDAGARVVGREEGMKDEGIPEQHFRLFQRYMRLAKESKNQAKIDEGLADSYKWGGAIRYRQEALAAGAHLIQKSDFWDTLLMDLWLSGVETPEVVEVYAREVLNHGPEYELASRGGFNELLAAAYMGDDARLGEEIKKSGANHKDAWGRSALIWASSSPHTSETTISLLLNAGVPVGDGSDQNPSALIAAIKHRRYDLALKFVRGGAIASIGREHRSTVLYSSLHSGSGELAKACIAAGLKVTKVEARELFDGIGRSGNPQLVKAVQDACEASGLSQEDLQYALNAGLVAAVMQKSEANIKLLWDLGGRIVPVDREGGAMVQSALSLAATLRDEAVFELIIDLAAKQGFLEKMEKGGAVTEGEAAMVFACGYGNKSLVDKLLANGVVPTGKNPQTGTNVLCAAAGSGSSELVKMFLDRGFDVNAEDSYGGTALLHAVGPKWSPELLDLLIGKGARVNVFTPNSSCPTLVAAAVDTGDRPLLEKVLKLGAPTSIKIEAHREWDALGSAIGFGNLKAVQMLLDAGVKPGFAKGLLGPQGDAKSHLELAKQFAESGDIGDSKEILKLIEAASK